jgi:hypothetical protein
MSETGRDVKASGPVRLGSQPGKPKHLQDDKLRGSQPKRAQCLSSSWVSAREVRRQLAPVHELLRDLSCH